MKILLSLSLFLIFLSSNICGQDALDLKREADMMYSLEKFDEALELYKQSLSLSHRPETLFNLGNTLYKLGRYDEAAQYFSQAKESFSEPVNKSDAAYNLGNSFFEKMEMEQALNAYRESLIHNSANEDARNNFLLAKELMEMMPQSPQQGNGDEEAEEDQQQIDNGAESMADQDRDQENDEYNQNEVNEDSLEEGEQTSESLVDDLAESDMGELDPTQGLLDQLLELAEEEDQRTQRKMNEQRRQPSQVLRDW